MFAPLFSTIFVPLPVDYYYGALSLLQYYRAVAVTPKGSASFQARSAQYGYFRNVQRQGFRYHALSATQANWHKSGPKTNRLPASNIIPNSSGSSEAQEETSKKHRILPDQIIPGGSGIDFCLAAAAA